MVTYGDMVLRDVKRRKKPVQRELPVQVAAIKYLELVLPNALVWHTPNGGRRSMRAAIQMKALGTKPGVTDLIMLPPIDNRGLFPAYFLEAKAPKGGTLSGDQKNFRAEVLNRGFAWGIFRNNDELEVLLRQWGFNLRARIRNDDQRLAGREPA